MDTYAASLEKWLQNQMPRVAKKSTLRLLDTPPLHISTARIKMFSPRIPLSLTNDEDKTVPRVCCSVDLARCLASARHILRTDEPPRQIFIYAFTERSVVQPSIELSQEPVRAGEVWIVPHRMGNWELYPDVIGELRLMEMNGEGNRFVFAVRCGQSVTLRTGETLREGPIYRIEVTINRQDCTVNVGECWEIDPSIFDRALDCYTVSN